MKNHRFLWLRNRTTDNRKCEKARNIKEKRTIEMFSTVSKQLVELLSSQKDNQIYIAYQLRSFDFGVSFCADFGSSEQSSCGTAKNSPQDCFLNGRLQVPSHRLTVKIKSSQHKCVNCFLWCE